MSQTDDKMSDFEGQLAQLDKIVTGMEQGGLSLEDALQKFEQGVALIKKCQQTLSAAEQKVKILTEQKQLESYDEAS